MKTKIAILFGVFGATGAFAQAVPKVSVSAINQNPAKGAPGQLDVILNVDAGGGVLQSVAAILKCGNDSLVQTQTIASSSRVPSRRTEPVTISFNTARFNKATGAPALHNGAACTVSASATAGTGAKALTGTNAEAMRFTMASADRGAGLQTATKTSVVHRVVVTPQLATLRVGQKTTLAASVEADAGVTDRTVTWSTSDATVVSVGRDGTVTALKAGKVTITAVAKANPEVKGAAIVSVTGAKSPAGLQR